MYVHMYVCIYTYIHIYIIVLTAGRYRGEQPMERGDVEVVGEGGGEDEVARRDPVHVELARARAEVDEHKLDAVPRHHAVDEVAEPVAHERLDAVVRKP